VSTTPGIGGPPAGSAAGRRVGFAGVRVVYPGGVVGIDGVDLEIAPGQLLAVIGPSGAGKSTLVRAINGLVPVAAGSLHVGSVDVAAARGRELRALRAEIGMIFQGFNLVPRRSVLANVLTGRLHAQRWWDSLVGRHRAEDVDIAFDALESVGIIDKAWVRASRLSGGQQQRVAIARALAQRPGVMLADEPVASLDPPTAHRVLRDLQRINRDLGITTVVNLHAVELARQYAERIVGLNDGRIVFDGAPDDVDEAALRHIYAVR
jgi:phosphonate transport system ATP-binding protein